MNINFPVFYSADLIITQDHTKRVQSFRKTDLVLNYMIKLLGAGLYYIYIYIYSNDNYLVSQELTYYSFAYAAHQGT